jgi:predicted HTH domain antitoxin
MKIATNKHPGKKALTVYLPESAEVSEFNAKMILACGLYETGVLSTGQAAEMVGITKRQFIEQMGKYGASLFHLTSEELESDIRNAQ